MEGLNAVDWDEDRMQDLELALHTSTQTSYCGDPGGNPTVMLILYNGKIYVECLL